MASKHRVSLAAWLVLIDLDHAAECAPPFLAALLPNPAPMMRLRVAVRAIEAWLLADRERLAGFLGVPESRLPRDPDAVEDPKRVLVDLARRSRRKAMQEDMVPRLAARGKSPAGREHRVYAGNGGPCIHFAT